MTYRQRFDRYHLDVFSQLNGQIKADISQSINCNNCKHAAMISDRVDSRIWDLMSIIVRFAHQSEEGLGFIFFFLRYTMIKGFIYFVNNNHYNFLSIIHVVINETTGKIYKQLISNLCKNNYCTKI